MLMPRKPPTPAERRVLWSRAARYAEGTDSHRAVWIRPGPRPTMTAGWTAFWEAMAGESAAGPAHHTSEAGRGTLQGDSHG